MKFLTVEDAVSYLQQLGLCGMKELRVFYTVEGKEYREDDKRLIELAGKVEEAISGVFLGLDERKFSCFTDENLHISENKFTPKDAVYIKPVEQEDLMKVDFNCSGGCGKILKIAKYRLKGGIKHFCLDCFDKAFVKETKLTDEPFIPVIKNFELKINKVEVLKKPEPVNQKEIKCGKCGGGEYSKSGVVRGEQRYVCKSCGRIFFTNQTGIKYVTKSIKNVIKAYLEEYDNKIFGFTVKFHERGADNLIKVLCPVGHPQKKHEKELYEAIYNKGKPWECKECKEI